MKSQPSSLSTPLFHYFLFHWSQSRRPEDEQVNGEGVKAKRKEMQRRGRPTAGWTPQRMTEELKEGNEKRTVKVEMQKDCSLLWSLCDHSLSNGACLICCAEARLSSPPGVGYKTQTAPQHRLRTQRTNSVSRLQTQTEMQLWYSALTGKRFGRINLFQSVIIYIYIYIYSNFMNLFPSQTTFDKGQINSRL